MVGFEPNPKLNFGAEVVLEDPEVDCSAVGLLMESVALLAVEPNEKDGAVVADGCEVAVEAAGVVPDPKVKVAVGLPLLESFAGAPNGDGAGVVGFSIGLPNVNVDGAWLDFCC